MGQAHDGSFMAEMTEVRDLRARAVLLCCDGSFQRDLASLLHCEHELLGVVVVKDPAVRGGLLQRMRRLLHPVKFLRHLIARMDMRRSAMAARALYEELFCRNGTPPAFPSVPTLEVSNVNDSAAVEFVKRLAPEVVCVNGTNLLREPMLTLASQIPLGIVNLHTGLSPYTRGGNCNLFALLEGHPEWVGVTIHYIDAGIDSGDLIKTAQVQMSPFDLYDHVDMRTFRLGNDLLVNAVKDLKAGRSKRVPQWQDGRLYLRRTGFVYEPWHWFQVNRMLRRGLIRKWQTSGCSGSSDVRLV